MAARVSSEIDSYLFHVIGDEDSIAAHRAKVAAAPEMASDDPAESDVTHLESATELGIELSADGYDSDDPAELSHASDVPPPPGAELPSYEKGIPVILQVRRLSWDGTGMYGFRASSRVGDVVAGNASVAAIRQLGEDPDVIRIDVSRDAGTEELNVSVPAVRGDAVHRPPVN
jgi:hypothetical protein